MPLPRAWSDPMAIMATRAMPLLLLLGSMVIYGLGQGNAPVLSVNIYAHSPHQPSASPSSSSSRNPSNGGMLGGMGPAKSYNDDDDTEKCVTHLVKAGETCEAIVSQYDTVDTVAQLVQWNREGPTWAWRGCQGDNLKTGQMVCVSHAPPPLPPQLKGVQCGAQAEPRDAECPNKECCSEWGYCSNQPDHCRKDPENRPGLGCQSNCKTLGRVNAKGKH